MTINFEPYIRNAQEVYQKDNVGPVAASVRIQPVSRNVIQYGADFDYIEAVDPVIKGEPGWLFDHRV